MMLEARSMAVALALFLPSWSTATGLDVPMSQKSFEDACTEGMGLKPGQVVESYHLGTRHLATGTIDAYLSTPYARALYLASKRGKGSSLPKLEALWDKGEGEKAVYLLVTSLGTPSRGFIEPKKDEPSIERVKIHKPAGESGDDHIPIARERVTKRSEGGYFHSLSMNWGWLFEFDPTIFSGDGHIELIIETTSHRAVIPVDRGKLLALPENTRPLDAGLR